GLRNGIRRVADARIAARDDRPWPALRCPDLSVDPREEPGGGRVLGHHPRRRRGARAPRLAIAPDVPAPPAMYGTRLSTATKLTKQGKTGKEIWSRFVFRVFRAFVSLVASSEVGRATTVSSTRRSGSRPCTGPLRSRNR